MSNLATCLLAAAKRGPRQPFGTIEQPLELGDAVARALTTIDLVGGAPGERWALLGSTSTTYLVAWIGLHLAGKEVALVNPDYPDDLLAEMMADLAPVGVLWIGAPPRPVVAPEARHLAIEALPSPGDGASAAELPGLRRRGDDVAGYMHTSGSTGRPKFCAQSHDYFLGLGAYVAEILELEPADTVFAPLPMFHVNPLGYGVVGALAAGAGVLGAERFSAGGFWPAVVDHGVTKLILHAPPIEILKRSPPAPPPDHSVRGMFYADGEFMERFAIPWATSVYGSTEAGGISHSRRWRRGERCDTAGGMSRFGGVAREGLEWRLDDDQQILIREAAAGTLFSGYLRGGSLDRGRDAAGWFATGDAGLRTEDGQLIFLERQTEAIRVKGEYVPIGFVEERFASLPVDDLALWRAPSDLVDDQLVLFVAAAELPPIDSVSELAAQLPRFMRPTKVALVAEIPRLSGVTKVRRRELSLASAIEVVEL